MTGDQDIFFTLYLDQIIYSEMHIQHTRLQYRLEMHRAQGKKKKKKAFFFQLRLSLNRHMTQPLPIRDCSQITIPAPDKRTQIPVSWY